MIIRIQQLLNGTWTPLMDIPVDDLTDTETQELILGLSDEPKESKYRRVFNAEINTAILINADLGPISVGVLPADFVF